MLMHMAREGRVLNRSEHVLNKMLEKSTSSSPTLWSGCQPTEINESVPTHFHTNEANFIGFQGHSCKDIYTKVSY